MPSTAARTRNAVWPTPTWGNTKEAINDHNMAILLEPDNAEYYFHRGRAYDDRGEFDWAIADYSRAIEINAGDSRYFSYRARAFESKGDDAKAEEDLQTAIRMRPHLGSKSSSLPWE